MESNGAFTGSCLCGAVQVTATPKSHHFGACHCDMCRKWGGGPFLAVECEEAVSFEGDDHISTFASSDWADRGFCSHCGTHLFYRLKEGGHYAIPVELFDDADEWHFAEQIFIDRKPSFYSFSDQTKNMTGEEVFAAFAAE